LSAFTTTLARGDGNITKVSALGIWILDAVLSLIHIKDGEQEKDKFLLENYDVVVEEYLKLKPT
jgi:hypothetical protein